MKVINIQDIDIPEDCATYDELAQFADKIAELALNYLEVAEPKTGRWVEDTEQSAKHIEKIYFCSNCHNFEAWGETELYNFCPNCGADMRGEA